MDTPNDVSGQGPSHQSFFRIPPNFSLWTHLGQRYWGGLLCGIGLGMFVAKFLQDFNMWENSPGVGFVAICLIGGGSGLALRATRHAMLQEVKQRMKS